MCYELPAGLFVERVMRTADVYFKANMHHWNGVTPIHARSSFYDLKGFRTGRSTLTPVEREEVGEVRGKSLLHLQCHFGLDTLSWARLGARVTGVDFSDRAIELARSLADDLGLEATFLLSNIYELRSVLDERFDIVFTSQGVLPWLPDIEAWAGVAAHFLKAGGSFYILEMHPILDVYYDLSPTADRGGSYGYFHSAEPLESIEDSTYADPTARTEPHTIYEWTHSLGDIVSSLVTAGLKIEFLHEFPVCVYRHLPQMELGEDGWWRLNGREGSIPLMFSIKATKPAEVG